MVIAVPDQLIEILERQAFLAQIMQVELKAFVFEQRSGSAARRATWLMKEADSVLLH